MEKTVTEKAKIKNWLTKDKRPIVIAGPCSAETEEQVFETCRAIAKTNKADILRAGIWKPRTRPGTFEGIGIKGLPWMRQMKIETGLPVTVEVAKPGHVEACLEFDIDILWVGARTTVNPFAVQELAEAVRGTNIPILVKNPINPDLALWLGGIERFERMGITEIGAIHRGFSNNSEKVYRNRPEWQMAIDFMRERPELPIICDPSHICGRRDLLKAVSQKAMDLNYDGLMIETHRDPDNAWSDAKQQITPAVFADMITELVLRFDREDDELAQSSLEFMRQEINEIDDDLINLLGQRMGVARKIGEYKKKNNITILQPKRWEEILNKAFVKGDGNQLSRDFVTKLLRAIHDESIDQQEKIITG
jgi:chorismate mutase